MVRFFVITLAYALPILGFLLFLEWKASDPNLPRKQHRVWYTVYLMSGVLVFMFAFYAQLRLWLDFMPGLDYITWYLDMILDVLGFWVILGAWHISLLVQSLGLMDLLAVAKESFAYAWMIPAAAVVTLLAYAAVLNLKATGRPIYFKRIGRQHDSHHPPPNIVTDVTRVRHIGLPYLFLLTAAVPAFAWPEEMIFRHLPYYSWGIADDGVRLAVLMLMSVFIFSLVHIASGYDFGTIIVMAMIPALCFTLIFWLLGSIGFSARFHVALNYVALPFYGAVVGGQYIMVSVLRKLRMIPAGT